MRRPLNCYCDMLRAHLINFKRFSRCCSSGRRLQRGLMGSMVLSAATLLGILALVTAAR